MEILIGAGGGEPVEYEHVAPKAIGWRRVAASVTVLAVIAATGALTYAAGASAGRSDSRAHRSEAAALTSYVAFLRGQDAALQSALERYLALNITGSVLDCRAILADMEAERRRRWSAVVSAAPELTGLDAVLESVAVTSSRWRRLCEP